MKPECISMYTHVHVYMWCVTGVVLHISPHSSDTVSKHLLEEAKLDPNAKNNDGDTPLHLACRNENYIVVKLLVRDERCNPHEKNSEGDTVLHIACRFKFTGTV